MSARLRAAIACSSAGMLLAVACLARSRPLPITLFFLVGLPCFLLGIVLYLSVVWQLLSRRLERR